MPPSRAAQPSISLASLSSLRVSRHLVPAHNRLPNSSIQNKPLLIYHGAILPADGATPTSLSPARSTRAALPAGAVESLLSRVGVVTPRWRYTMYPTTHFHSTSHEVLCVTRGRALLCFGGEENPGRVEAAVEAGDVVVVPAGMAHRLLEDVEGGFEMVGSYPPGHSWDMCYGRAGEEEQVREIARLVWFGRDPIFGDEGPVLDV